jgi:hypothetical protein
MIALQDSDSVLNLSVLLVSVQASTTELMAIRAATGYDRVLILTALPADVWVRTQLDDDHGTRLDAARWPRY